MFSPNVPVGPYFGPKVGLGAVLAVFGAAICLRYGRFLVICPRSRLQGFLVGFGGRPRGWYRGGARLRLHGQLGRFNAVFGGGRSP